MGWYRQNGSFGDLFGSIDWSGFERIFLQFLNGFMLMKGLFGASWRAHNRGGVEIFLAMNRRYEGTFFSPLHLWNRTVKILYYVDFWGSLDS